MARFVGSSADRSAGLAGGGGTTLVQEFERAVGITTDANNNVTSVTLGTVSYTNVLYNNVGLITSFTETSGSSAKNYEMTYNADYYVTNITEV